jgi:hypothetical protein
MSRISAAILCFITAVLGPANVKGQATAEETIVKTTYAKLAYAAQLGTIHKALREIKQPKSWELESWLADEAIKFELYDFSSGPISDIAQRAYGDLVTKPDGQDVLDVSMGILERTEDLLEKPQVRQTRESDAKPRWTSGQNLTGANWNIPFHQILPFLQRQKSAYSRYVAYKVTVTFQASSRSYRAMFLFGTGEEPVLVLDNVTVGPGAATRNSVYPAVLLETSLGQKAAVADWLKLHQVSDAVCPPGQREVCCDPNTLTCGVSAGDVKSALSKPLSEKATAPTEPGQLAKVL